MKNNPLAFCTWLQGYVELNGQVPTKEQWESIVEHLGLVFDKQTKAIKKPLEIPQTTPEFPQIPQRGTHIDWSKYLPKDDFRPVDYTPPQIWQQGSELPVTC